VQSSTSVSSGSYYRWRKQRITARLQRKIDIKEQITSIYFESKQRYGSTRITFELQNLGYKISRPDSLLEQAKQLQ
jgi:putative transposase